MTQSRCIDRTRVITTSDDLAPQLLQRLEAALGAIERAAAARAVAVADDERRHAALRNAAADAVATLDRIVGDA